MASSPSSSRWPFENNTQLTLREQYTRHRPCASAASCFFPRPMLCTGTYYSGHAHVLRDKCLVDDRNDRDVTAYVIRLVMQNA